MSRKPSSATINEWHIAGVALSKDDWQRQVWCTLKILTFKLHCIASSLTGEQGYSE